MTPGMSFMTDAEDDDEEDDEPMFPGF